MTKERGLEWLTEQRGLAWLAEQRELALMAFQAEQLQLHSQAAGGRGVQLHIDRAHILAGQRYLRKEYGSAAARAARKQG